MTNCRVLQPERPQSFVSVRAVYDDSVAVSRAVIAVRFAPWVRKWMDIARASGLGDDDMKARGVPVRTAYRWAAGDLGTNGPTPRSVFAFCDGLGAPRKEAMTLLDWSDDEVRATTPEPETPREFRELMRRLNDPRVSKSEKTFIRQTLRSLIARRPHTTGRDAE